MAYHAFSPLVMTLVFVAMSRVSRSDQATPTSSNDAINFPPLERGDPRACIEYSRQSGGTPLQRFEVLPGVGWDNLRNVPTGQVMAHAYTKCRTTDDGRFVVPDSVFSIPIKTSIVDAFAEMFETWHNTTSTTASSININSGLSFWGASISGSYSREYQRTKSNQIGDKAITTRVQLRYLRYLVRSQPDSRLHDSFKGRLLEIAADIKLNRTKHARYKGQLLVRDFGTHVVKSVTAGAILVKTDYLRRTYIESSSFDKTATLAKASFSFKSFFKITASYGRTVTATDMQTYNDAMTHSYVESHGGPILMAYNMTTNQWTSGVDLDMVPIDRAGDPLYFLVTENHLPEIPPSLVDQVEYIVRRSIEQFYEMNSIRGCTKLHDPNFSPAANIDDGSCSVSGKNLTFGGLFQSCVVSGSYLTSDPCDGMSVVNPLTKGQSCPTGFQAVKLNTGSKTGRRDSTTHCRRCGFLWLKKCCHTNYYQARAIYTLSWCAATEKAPQDSGYLFGGIFSATSLNLVTGTKRCPSFFYRVPILQGYSICLSTDYELGGRSAVPFGGFSSCSIGNPLAVSDSAKSTNSEMKKIIGPDTWPHRCPKGYSQHLAAIDNGCEIRYCVETGSLAGPALPPVKLPPYGPRPMTVRSDETFVMFDSKSKKWTQGEAAIAKVLQSENAELPNFIQVDDNGNIGPPKSKSAASTFMHRSPLWGIVAGVFVVPVVLHHHAMALWS